MSKYEDKLAAAIARSTPFHLTDEQNLQIAKDLSKGMEDFILQEKKIRTETMIEARTIVIGSNTSI